MKLSICVTSILLQAVNVLWRNSRGQISRLPSAAVHYYGKKGCVIFKTLSESYEFTCQGSQYPLRLEM